MTTEVHQWHNADESPNDYLLVRMYDDGEVTGQRYLFGVPSVECTLASHPLRIEVAS